MPSGGQLWADVDAGSSLRPYQRSATEQAVAALNADGGRICIVAPPGSGKTRCALHIAAAMQRPVEVRVPTTALVQQWQSRIDANLVSLDSGAEAPVAVSTYAAKDEFAPGALVVLDEAHHLCGTWGRELLARINGDHRVLGLTGTAPFGHPGWDQFVTLVGADPVRVRTPPLVRGGYLCPYQELIWPVLADPDDVPDLVAAAQRLTALEDEHSAALLAWRLVALHEDLWELTEARFAQDDDLLVALCRTQLASGAELPADLPSDPAFSVQPTLYDRALVLHRAMGKQVRKPLAALGIKVRGDSVELADDLGWRALAASHTRLRGCLSILKHEQRVRPDSLRALVITDRDTEGGRLSARAVMRALTVDEDTDRTDPILVTGSVCWIDDDLWPKVERRFPDLAWQVVDGHHELDVSGWSTSERVALVTELLSEGLTRCLVGTRHLLGEGWDCPAVNCVVDLTGIVASITVNQVRGRALRLDPQDPSKVASLWEVAVLAPGLPGGERMLDRLGDRHENTLGIDAVGRIRAGLDRIDPTLTLDVAEVARQIDAIQERMVARLADPVAIAELWSVGTDFSNSKQWQLQGAVATGTRVVMPKATKVQQAKSTSLVVTVHRRGARVSGLKGVAGVLAIASIGLAAAVVSLPLAAVTGVASLTTAVVALVLQRRQPDPNERRDAMLRALSEALDVELSVDGGALRNADEASAEAVAELFGPIRYPRYLLIEPMGDVWPVPAALGRSREVVATFTEAWSAHVGPVEAVFARQGRGREILKAAWKADRPSEITVMEQWE